MTEVPMEPLLGDRYLRMSPARIAASLQLAKRMLVEDFRHSWTQSDEDWFVTQVLHERIVGGRWTSTWDVAIYIYAMFRHSECNMV